MRAKVAAQNENFDERKAFLVAIVAAGTALAATLGLAMVIQPAQFPAAGALPDNAASAAEGRHLFLLNCAHCHGDDAHGDEGPDLYNLHKSDARIHQVITAGIKGEMPSFGKKLRDPDVRAITAYLRTLHANTGIDGSHVH
jgi:cytochrome c oxidase cbb3-type subunit 3